MDHAHADRMQRLLAQALADRAQARGQGQCGQPLLLELVHSVIVGAMKVAAQQAVARFALSLCAADHPAHGHAHQR